MTTAAQDTTANGSTSRPRKARSSASRPPKGSISASMVYGRMEKQDKDIAAVKQQVGEVGARVDIFQMTIQRVEKAQKDHAEEQSHRHNELLSLVSKMVALVGEEREDGAGGTMGTGLLGRMRRAENSILDMIRAYKTWIAFGIGFCTCAGAFIVALWWLVGDKLAVVLK